MAVRGVFMSNQSIPGDRNTSLSGRVLMHGLAGSAPLLALSSGMPEVPVSDTSWSWTEDQHISGNTTNVGAQNSSATALTVADSNLWVPQSVLLVEATGEHMLVTAVSGNSITVVRGIAGTTAASISDGARIQSIGTAFKEGGGKPAPVTQQGETYTNIVQIFKNGWAITGTAKAVKYALGSKLAHNKETCFAYHAEDIERAFLFGKKGQQVINGDEYRFSNGILNQISLYGGLVVSAAYGGTPGNMSIAGLTNFIRKVFDRRVKGLPNERIAFTSTSVVELMQHMARLDSTVEINVNTDTFGFNITTISFMGYQLKLMTHPLMVENPTWATQMYVFHPGLIEKRILRPTWTEEFGPAKENNNGVDADEGYIADEMGFHVAGARTMGMMTNISAAVAS